MGLFDNNEGSREEVVIDPPVEKKETKLKKEVSSKLTDKENRSSDLTLEDIHDQNKRIIELLEQIKGEDGKNDQEIKGGMDELL